MSIMKMRQGFNITYRTEKIPDHLITNPNYNNSKHNGIVSTFVEADSFSKSGDFLIFFKGKKKVAAYKDIIGCEKATMYPMASTAEDIDP